MPLTLLDAFNSTLPGVYQLVKYYYDMPFRTSRKTQLIKISQACLNDYEGWDYYD